MNSSRAALLFDPGWLFLIAGMALLGATVLIPAGEDLDEARWLRDRALRVESHRQQRLTRYEEYFAALLERDPALVQSLAASQLNQIPVGQAAMPGFSPMRASASVFPALEPPVLKLPEREVERSALAKLATGERSRLWLIAAGSLCVLVGLLPTSKGE
jgi:hypothetical protein